MASGSAVHRLQDDDLGVEKLNVTILRKLFRLLQNWESLYEATGLDTLRDPATGNCFHLADIRYLYDCRRFLSPRQCQAIEWCLYHDRTEADVAVMMGISPTNPVAMYATKGMSVLLEMAREGELTRYKVMKEN